MSAFARKNAAMKAYMTLARSIGYNYKGNNLRAMSANGIEEMHSKLKEYASKNKSKYVPRYNMRRSDVIKRIKEINPAFRSSHSDTYESLIRKYRENLPVKPYLSDIRSNARLIKFLMNPVDGAIFITTAKDLIQNVERVDTRNGYYLVMHSSGTKTEELTNITTPFDDYKVISNIDSIKKLLSIIEKGSSHIFEDEGFGSDVEVLLSLVTDYNSTIELTWYSIESYRRVHSGAYFKYYNRTKFDLTRYQIFDEEYDSSKEDEINCLIYALEQSGKVPKNDLDDIKFSLFNEIKARDFKSISKRLGITINLRFDAKQSTRTFNAGCETEISIGLVDNHYFLNDLTNITKYAIENYFDVKEHKNFPLVQPKKHKQLPLSAFQVINTIFTKYKDTMLRPINLSTISNKACIDKIIEYDALRAPKAQCDCGMWESEKVSCAIDFGSSLCTHSYCRAFWCNSLRKRDKNNKKINYPTCEFRDYSESGVKLPFKGNYSTENDPNENYDIWFIDTETFIKEGLNYHVPTTLCAIKYHEQIDRFSHVEFFGLNCVKEFLDFLGGRKRAAIIYAHNMAFDFRVFIDHLYDLDCPIESGTKLKQVKAKYCTGITKNEKGKESKSFIHLLFKDSYAFLACKLSELPSMFRLECGDKEVYPYTLINESNYDKCVPLSECRKHIKVGLRKAFALNARKIGALDENNMVDMKKYTIHYCMQDTRILAQAFICFRKQILEICKKDVVALVSLPQLADEYMRSQGVYAKCFSIAGISQDFIKRCTVGGRVMLAANKQNHIIAGEDRIKNDEGVYEVKSYTQINGKKIYHTEEDLNYGPIADFDGVSLYPSAIVELMGFVQGLPKVLTDMQLKHFDEVKSKFDAYYVEIEVLSHSINRDFPLQSVKTKSGIRDFTNNIDGKRFYLDNIALEDFVEFQGVEYKVIRGYYFDEGLNTRNREVMTFMFNERLRLKSECMNLKKCEGVDCKGKKCKGNPLQVVYKLLMNAAYGKLIQKAIKTSKKFVEADKLRKYVARNHKFIDSYTRINDELYVVREHKSIVDHFNVPHIASNILSMSKRIMNRVMCLAEDEGIKIYYQDTDSMHLHDAAIGHLSKKFKEKYGKDLIGKGLGQFHTDFEVPDSGAKNIRAVESIFLGKKCYIDKLKYENAHGNSEYHHHIRMKGTPTQSVIDYDSDVMGTYKKLLNKQMLEFDMAKYCPLQIDKDYRARANTRCLSRKLIFLTEEEKKARKEGEKEMKQVQKDLYKILRW